MFSGGGHLSAAQQAFWTIALQRTLAPARKTRRPGQPERKAELPFGPAPRGHHADARRDSPRRPTRPSTDRVGPHARRRRPPLAVTAGRIPSRSVSAFRSGCTAVRSGLARRGGFSGRGDVAAEAASSKTLAALRSRARRRKTWDPLRRGRYCCPRLRSRSADERPAAAATTLRSQARSATASLTFSPLVHRAPDRRRGRIRRRGIPPGGSAPETAPWSTHPPRVSGRIPSRAARRRTLAPSRRTPPLQPRGFHPRGPARRRHALGHLARRLVDHLAARTSRRRGGRRRWPRA